jgi:tocopherol O-methyltransferase
MPQSASGSHNVQRLVSYFDETHLHYRVLWMTSQALAMHMGYWDAETPDHASSLVNMNRVLAARGRMRPGDRVLDAGCGVGGSAIWLVEEFGVEVTGINVVERQLRDAQRHARRHGVNDRVRFEYQDITCTTFPADSFNVVWAIESACHTQEKRTFLTEARRLLVPGGRLLVADGFRTRRPLRPSEEQLLSSWLAGWAVPDLVTGEEFTNVAREVGFEHIRFEDISPNVQPSLRRLYRMARAMYPPGRAVLRPLHLISDTQLANACSALLQYQAFQRGLWLYGIFTALAG